MTDLSALELLYRALSTPAGIGIVVQVSDFKRAAQALYKARREAGDPALAPLQFRVSPLGLSEELWIVRSGPLTPGVPNEP